MLDRKLFSEGVEIRSLFALFFGIVSCLLEFMICYGFFEAIDDELETLLGFRYLPGRWGQTLLYHRPGGIQ